MSLLTRLRRRRRWTIVTSAPGGDAGEQWGDTWFARDLARALESLGERAQVVGRRGAASQKRDEDDVVLVLRGLNAVQPRGDATWLLWVISHPELVHAQECAGYAAVFAASAHWSRAGELGAIPLLQATDPARFSPMAAAPDSGAGILFVGSTRGEFRPIVRDALACGVDVSVHGVGWEAYLPAERIRGAFLPNDRLPAAYASAGVVLNDHWPDMAHEGFLSNRLFDAVASGARVVSDPATGLAEVFGDAVRVATTPEELCALLTGDREAVLPSRADRLAAAGRIARDHSFQERARRLIEQVERLR